MSAVYRSCARAATAGTSGPQPATALVGAVLAPRPVAVGGERSPSWLAALRFTSVEHLPAHSHSPSGTRICSSAAEFAPGWQRPCHFVIKAAGFGVLVCKAFRERSEQRTNKYPEVGGWRSRAGARSYRAAVAAVKPAVWPNPRPRVRTWRRRSAARCSSPVRTRRPGRQACPEPAWSQRVRRSFRCPWHDPLR